MPKTTLDRSDYTVLLSLAERELDALNLKAFALHGKTEGKDFMPGYRDTLKRQAEVQLNLIEKLTILRINAPTAGSPSGPNGHGFPQNAARYN